MQCKCCGGKEFVNSAGKYPGLCLDCQNYIVGWEMGMIADEQVPGYVAEYIRSNLKMSVKARWN